MSSIVQKLETVLDASAVVAWEQVDPRLKSQITQAHPQAGAECVVYPATAEELAEVVTCARLNRWKMLPCGRGSKLHWGGLAQEVQLVVSLAKLTRMIEHASGDLTVTAEAGLQLSDLQSQLATAGQFLSIDPAYPEQATLGGIVATADTGALRQRYGGIRDLLIGVTFVRSDGKLTKAGGRVVKNVAGYDLMKLMTGSYGTLGILSQLTFRIYPLPDCSQTVVFTGDAPALAKMTATLLASALTPTAIELLTPALVKALGMGTDFGLVVRFQSIEVSVTQQTQQSVQLGQSLGLTPACLSTADELTLWRQLRESIDPAPGDAVITCKIGVEPARAVELLIQIEQASAEALGVIHAGSGLGTVRFPALSSSTLLNLRQVCQSQGGFLTVLAAPYDLKRQIEVWGYPGNALSLMQGLKAQFDPENLFSPHRFVGGI